MYWGRRRWFIIALMRVTSRRQVRCASALILTMIGAVVQAQDQRRPDFTSRVELVTTDVVVRDNGGQFIADLKKDDFEVLEDGVTQKVVSFSLTHGGRSYNIAAPPPAPVAEGILLPAVATGQRRGRPHLPDLRRRPAPRLPQHRADSRSVQEDLRRSWFTKETCSASSPPAPRRISIDLTYDRRRLTEAIKKISGRRARAEGHPRRAAGVAGTARSALPRARRVLDRVGHDAASSSRSTTAARRSST